MILKQQLKMAVIKKVGKIKETSYSKKNIFSNALNTSFHILL